MPEELKELVQQYQEGRISRRDFMRQAVVFTGSLAAANSLIDTLMPSGVEAAMVPETDPDILTHNVEYKGKAGPVYGYLTRPVKAGKYPAIVLVSDNAGLGDHIRDVARRYAKQGYVVLVPDVFSRQGGTAKFNPKGTGVGKIREAAPEAAMIEDIDAGFVYLKMLPDVRADRLGLTGFCWGGEIAFAAATKVRGIDALVIFYGRSPDPLDSLKDLQAPVLAHYGEKDPDITKNVPATEATMKKYNKSYTYKIYPGAQHAFFHDLRADRYDSEAAKDTWSRTLEFFNRYLKS
jgi:carboxymethylenebutenolidase